MAEGKVKPPRLEDKFTLVMNPADEGQCWFEFEETKEFPINRVWTIVEGESTESMYAQTGYHIVNVVYYAVTEEEWTAEDEQIDYLWFDEEDMT